MISKSAIIGASISGLTGIHQFTKIGEHCMVGRLIKIVKDVPPYIIAARDPLSFAVINIVGLKRRGFEQSKLKELKEIYRIIFQQKRIHHTQLVSSRIILNKHRKGIKFLVS